MFCSQNKARLSRTLIRDVPGEVKEEKLPTVIQDLDGL